MLINKVLNNNVAVVIDEIENEKIVMGRGICYKKKPLDRIDVALIEKEFILKDDNIRKKFETVATAEPHVCLEISEYIIKKAINILGKELNENIYVSLTDHIQFTINRYCGGLQLKNDMLWHIKRIYPGEFKLGQEAVELINNNFNINLTEDECSFIAIHIVSAELNQDINNIMNITKTIQDILNIITYNFNITIDEDSMHYFRFITHLRCFAQRVSKSLLYENETDESLFLSVKTSYPYAFDCSQKIGVYAKEKMARDITNEELMYLTIHIQRIIKEYKKGGK